MLGSWRRPIPVLYRTRSPTDVEFGIEVLKSFNTFDTTKFLVLRVWMHWTYKMIVEYIISGVRLRLSSFLHYLSVQ